MADDSVVDRAFDAGLTQPDATTCGSCVLVVARMLNDPAYAGSLVDGPSRGAGGAADDTILDRFRQQVLAMHRLTSRFKDSREEWQLPWPRALGTPPWAVAREMTNRAGERGTTYQARPVVPPRRSRAFDTIAARARAGHAVPLFVGNRWSPRHVVLVLPSHTVPQHDVLIYDPASGGRYPIARADFSAGTLHVAGWSVPWAMVVSLAPRSLPMAPSGSS